MNPIHPLGRQDTPPSRRSHLRELLIRARSSREFMLGFVLVMMIVLAAVFAPLISPHDPLVQDIMNKRIPPVWHYWTNGDTTTTSNHLLGTDKLGRDYLSRIIYGARISLTVAFATVLISGIIGTTLGVAAGYFGGRVDMLVSFIVTTRLSIPVVLVALAVVAIHGSSLAIIVMVLGLLLWDRFAVVMKAVTRRERMCEYVTAARTIGCSNWRIVFSEIFPNIMSTFVVVGTIEMANAILFEAALSFLGLGVQPPTPSWGLMLSEAKEDIYFSPWMITIPGVALFMLVLSINLLGDGVKEISTPRGRS